ncbi:MAG: ClpXP protease specificity-enhancing factor [Gammaproteobacteria bacterium]|nr:ClpXP protease specificity-enhancing factor [Gammaproteobacteria bacterium]
MTSNRPYLLKAFYQWIVDNECTPYIVVEADLPHVSVPPQTVTDGQVVLNINPTAVQSLLMDDHQVTFSARFGGVPFDVYIPIYAISAIYARENGAGTMFPPEELPEDLNAEDSDVITDKSKSEESGRSESKMSVVESDIKTSSEVNTEKSDDKSKKKKASHLSIVK